MIYTEPEFISVCPSANERSILPMDLYCILRTFSHEGWLQSTVHIQQTLLDTRHWNSTAQAYTWIHPMSLVWCLIFDLTKITKHRFSYWLDVVDSTYSAAFVECARTTYLVVTLLVSVSYLGPFILMFECGILNSTAVIDPKHQAQWLVMMCKAKLTPAKQGGAVQL